MTRPRPEPPPPAPPAGEAVAAGADRPWTLELTPAEAEARFRWARHRGHPQYLWPDVRPEALHEALGRLEGVVRDVLLGRQAELSASDPDAVRALGVAAFTSGLGALLGLWIEEGRIGAGELARRLLGHHLAHGRARATGLANMTTWACRALNARRITPLVVKSGHTARAYFPEPGARPSVDVDLVVRPEEFDAAEAALAEAGFVRAGSQGRPRKSDWMAPGSNPLPRSLELLHRDSQYAVDLHGSLARNFHGVRAVSPASVAGAPTAPAGFLEDEARVLAQPALMAYHVLHGSETLDHLTLVRLVELVLMARQDGAAGTLRWDDLVALLEARRGLGFAHPALLMTERLVPGTVPGPVLEATARAAPPLMREVLAGLRPGQTQRFHVLPLRERFMWCASIGDVARRIAHMALPAPAGASPRRLARLYVDRGYRIIRGRVSMGRERP